MVVYNKVCNLENYKKLQFAKINFNNLTTFFNVLGTRSGLSQKSIIAN